MVSESSYGRQSPIAESERERSLWNSHLARPRSSRDFFRRKLELGRSDLFNGVGQLLTGVRNCPRTFNAQIVECAFANCATKEADSAQFSVSWRYRNAHRNSARSH